MAGLRLSAIQMRHVARLWHLAEPGFVIETLVKSRILAPDDAAARAATLGYLQQAAGVGLWSKADLVQFAGLCLMAGGDILRVASVRGYLARIPETSADVMTGMLAHYGPAWITGLGRKVAGHD